MVTGRSRSVFTSPFPLAQDDGWVTKQTSLDTAPNWIATKDSVVQGHCVFVLRLGVKRKQPTGVGHGREVSGLPGRRERAPQYGLCPGAVAPHGRLPEFRDFVL